MYLESPISAPWIKLCEYVDYIKNEHPELPVLRILEKPMMDEGSIGALRENGWRFFSSPRFGENEGYTFFERKEIHLSEATKRGYIFDKILVHELVHAHFGLVTVDGGFDLNEYQRKRYSYNGAIVDFIARPLRAKPEFLRCALKRCWDGNIHAYDIPSLKAKYGLSNEEPVLPLDGIELTVMMD
jgi:hypothetical protein